MHKFQAHIEIAEALVATFGSQAEVVLHDLETEQIVHIVGGFSHREVGDPSLLHLIDFTPGARTIGPYEKTNWDGRRIRSVSIVLHDDQDHAFGLMCVNFDLSPFVKAALLLQTFTNLNDKGSQPDELFRDDWHERINRFVSNWVNKRQTSIDRLKRTQKQELVIALEQQGAFKAPGAIVYAARVLGLGRATIYKYIQADKESVEKPIC